MSYNGSGTFLINSAGQPVVANTVISATVFNALTSDLATGLSTAITKDGQTTITANIPFGSNKITGLGSGTAATDAANLGQVQSTAAKLITVTGTDTITGSMSPALTAYAAGQLFYFVSAGANTGPVTINIDSLGAKAITRDGSTALAAGDINSGEVVVVIYDGTRFQMINAANSFGNTTINGTLTVTGNTGLQANVSITSTLSVGGTFAVTGAATLGSTLAVTGKSDLPTVSTASINAAVALITTGTVTNLTASGASIASANIGNLQFTAASIASINAGVAVITNLTATGASIASANVGTAVITAATVTGASIASANVGTAVITTGTVTNLTSTSASVASANAGVALITTGTVTNFTSTSASIASANLGTAVVTGLTVTGASIASVNVGAAVLSGNLTLNGGTANGVLYLNASKVATSGSALTFDGTNLGVSGGTAIIDITANTQNTFDRAVTLSYAGSSYARWSNNYFTGETRHESGRSGSLGYFHTWYTDNAEGMRLTSTGLGIGTTSPSYRLQVETASASSDVVGYFRQSTYPVAYIKSGSGYVAFGQGATSGETRIVADGGGTASVNFYTGTGTERARIDSSGNLLVGTTTNKTTVVTGGATGMTIAAAGAPTLAIWDTTDASYVSYLSQINESTYFGNYANGPLYFQTNATTKATLDASGNLGLGVTPSAWASTVKALQVDSRTAIWQQSNVSVFSNNVYAASGGNTYIATAAATQYYQDASAHVWRTAPSGTAGNTITFTQVLAVEGGKSLALEGATSQSGTGITFPATQSASSNANTLDDYEEGTFTPIVKGRTTAGTGTYAYQFGSYVKVGKLVTVSVYIEWSAHTGTGQMVFAGLPFNATTTALYNSAAAFSYVDNIALTANNVLTGNINQTNNDGVNCWQYPVGGGGTTTVPVDSAGAVIFTVSYEI